MTYVARCLYVEKGRDVHVDVAKARMTDFFPMSYMTKHGKNSKAQDTLSRAVMDSFEKQGFSGHGVPARYVSMFLCRQSKVLIS